MRSFGIAGLLLFMMMGCSNTEDSFQLTVRTTLQTDDDGIVRFLTPSGTLTEFSASDLVGKPWVAGFFTGGAEVTVDPPVDRVWGVVPDTLSFDYSPDFLVESGPYDIAVVVYTTTEIADENKEGTPPFPQGDLSTFSFEPQVLEGDPEPEVPALLRVNVDGDTVFEVKNKVPDEDASDEDRANAAVNTILYLP